MTEIASKCLICWRQRVTCELHHADVTTAVQTQTMACGAHYAPLCSTIMLLATISQPFTVIHTPILALKLLRWQLYLNYIPATIWQLCLNYISTISQQLYLSRLLLYTLKFLQQCPSGSCTALSNDNISTNHLHAKPNQDIVDTAL